MKFLAAVILLSSCAFNEASLEEISESLDNLQMKYSELDSRLDSQAEMVDGLRDICIATREDLREANGKESRKIKKSNANTNRN